MPRLHRLDFRNALHTVRIQGREGTCIFFDSSAVNNSRNSTPHVRQFEQWLGDSCTDCSCLLHAYNVEPNRAAWVLQTTGVPLAAVMLRLGAQYSRYLHAQGLLPEHNSPFARRYESRVLAPEYLPHAVRRVHLSPVLAGLCQRATHYPFSSAQTYLGGPALVSVDMSAVYAVLERRGFVGLRGYREFMDLPETPYVARLFDNGSPLDARIVGGPLFVKQARDRASHPAVPPTREQLISAVTNLIHMTPAEISSATRMGVLARSLVAWHGLRAGAASLAEIGSWFGVSGATLGQGIRYHRRLTPGLFEQLDLSTLEHRSGTRMARESDEGL